MVNKLELFKYRNQVASYVRGYHFRRNVVNLNVHNSWQHEMTKTRICYLLKAEGKEFITEVPLLSKSKTYYADILVLDTAQVIEICVSETLEQVTHKTSKYPKMLEIIAIRDHTEYVNGTYKLIRNKEL